MSTLGRTRRPLLWAVLWLGALSVTVTTIMATRLGVALGGRPVYLVTTIALALLTLAFMYAENPALAEKCLRRLWPVLLFTAVTLATILIAKVRTPPYLRLLPNPLAPLSWTGAAILGYAVAKRRVFPLVVAAASVWVSLAAAALDLMNRSGLTTWLGMAYAAWSRSVGAWQPAAGEGFRAIGLDIDPNVFGLIGTVALVFAISLRGSPKSRAAIALGATLVLAASGSRTAAVAAVLAFAAWFVPSVGHWGGLRERARELVPALAGVALAVVLVVAGAVATGHTPDLLGRLQASGNSLESGIGGQNVAGSLDSATSGRFTIWSNAWPWVQRYPLGAFLPPELLGGRSIHNEYLERELMGGPISLGVFLLLLWWLFVRVRPAQAPAFGPAMSVAYGAAAFTIGVSMQGPFAAMGFYFIGWAVARVARGGDATG